MFIEKLTKEDVKEYLLSEYPEGKYRISNISLPSWPGDCIRAHIENAHSISDYEFNIRLEDFESSQSDIPWVNYLHEKFGDEYKKAYLDDAAKIFFN